MVEDIFPFLHIHVLSTFHINIPQNIFSKKYTSKYENTISSRKKSLMFPIPRNTINTN